MSSLRASGTEQFVSVPVITHFLRRQAHASQQRRFLPRGKVRSDPGRGPPHPEAPAAPPRSSAAATGLLRGEGGGRATHAAQRAPTPLPEGQSPPPPPPRLPRPPLLRLLSLQPSLTLGPPPADSLPGHTVRGSAGGSGDTPTPRHPNTAPGGRRGEAAPEAASEPGSSAARRGHVPPHTAPAPQASPPRPGPAAQPRPSQPALTELDAPPAPRARPAREQPGEEVQQEAQ